LVEKRDKENFKKQHRFLKKKLLNIENLYEKIKIKE